MKVKDRKVLSKMVNMKSKKRSKVVQGQKKVKKNKFKTKTHSHQNQQKRQQRIDRKICRAREDEAICKYLQFDLLNIENSNEKTHEKIPENDYEMK